MMPRIPVSEKQSIRIKQNEAGIACMPEIGFGNNGEGFMRMSLTVPDDRLKKAIIVWKVVI